jgi:hypothetical protein
MDFSRLFIASLFIMSTSAACSGDDGDGSTGTSGETTDSASAGTDSTSAGTDSASAGTDSASAGTDSASAGTDSSGGSSGGDSGTAGTTGSSDSDSAGTGGGTFAGSCTFDADLQCWHAVNEFDTPASIMQACTDSGGVYSAGECSKDALVAICDQTPYKIFFYYEGTDLTLAEITCTNIGGVWMPQ